MTLEYFTLNQRLHEKVMELKNKPANERQEIINKLQDNDTDDELIEYIRSLQRMGYEI